MQREMRLAMYRDFKSLTSLICAFGAWRKSCCGHGHISRQPPQLLVSVMFTLNCVDFLPCRGVCYSYQENSCCNCKCSSHAVGLSNDRLKPTQPHWLPCHERAAARISKCNLRVRVCVGWYTHIINGLMSLYRASTTEHRGWGGNMPP